MRAASWGLRLSEMMGSSMTISSTSWSTSVLHERESVLLREIEQVDGFGFLLAIAANVLQNDAGRIVAQKESFKLHRF